LRRIGWSAAGLALGAGLGSAWFWTERVAPQLRMQPEGEGLRAALTAPHVLVRRTGAGLDYECHCPLPARFEDLSPRLVDVLVGTEDRDFWTHRGVDPGALVRAVLSNAGGVRQGASTLPQQLVKMKLLSPEQTFERKVVEAVLSVKVMGLMDRKDVLAAYADAAWFARGVVGVEAAARHFFGKSARRLNLWESAVLVGMLKAPSRYNPHTDPEASDARARAVLAGMVAGGLLSREEADRAIARGPEPGREAPLDTEFRWYLDAARGEVRRLGLEPREGAGFVRAVLHLDVAQQRTAQASVEGARGDHLAALVAADADGRVRAVVGGDDYAARSWNLALHERSQIASLAKIPAAAVALRNGFGPDSAVLDAPLRGGWPRNGARPHTYGPVPLRHAFAHSLNAPFAQLVAGGIDGGVARMRALIGVCQPDLDVPKVESIATGAFDVTPWQALGLVASFTAGRCVTPRTVMAVTGPKGEVLHRDPGSPGTGLLPAATVATLGALMRGAVEQGTGRAARIPGVVVRGKTGTSEDGRHAWFAGIAEGGPVSVHWVASNPESRLREVSGTHAAAQFRTFQAALLADRAPAQPLPPARPKDLSPPPRPSGPWIVMGDQRMRLSRPF
jgi:membrane peptidoglycan carboxypeptidase